MIDQIIKQYLDGQLSVPSFFDFEKKMPAKFVSFERTSGGKVNHIKNSSFAFQSHADTKYEALQLINEVIEVVERMIELDEMSKIELNTYYDFTDEESKKYRYQAVFEITHY